MSVTITGSQFITSSTTAVYAVTGIPSGSELSSVILPSGWTYTNGEISGEGSQNITVTPNKISGTIIATYIKAGVKTATSIDVSTDAAKQGASITTTTTKGITQVSNVSLIASTSFIEERLNTNCPALYDNGCPFTLPVFADLDNPTSTLNNDKTDFYYQGGSNIASIAMTLQKSSGCNGVWNNVLALGTNYARQASLVIPITPWSGNYYMVGTFTIGAVVLTLDYNGVYAGYLTYLAALINGNGTYSATVQATGITVVGKNYNLSNGITVSQKLVNTSTAFNVGMTTADELAYTGTGTTINKYINPQTFRNTLQNNGGNWNVSTYTAGSDPIQTFAGIIYFQTFAAIPADFVSGKLTASLLINGIPKATVSLSVSTTALNALTFSFPPTNGVGTNPPTLNPGDHVTLELEIQETMSVSGEGGLVIWLGEFLGSGISRFYNTSSVTTSTTFGVMSGGVSGTTSFASFFAYGLAPDFSGNPFTDDDGNKYTGALLSWLPVLQTFGAGNYQMQIVTTDVYGNITTTYDNRSFCLNQYNCTVADNTVRIEYYNIGERGIFNDGWIDYASANLPLSNGSSINGNYPGWYSQIRLEAITYLDKSTYTKEYSQYGDDEYNAYKPVINEQTPKIKLDIMPIPGWMDLIISTNVLQADTILFTDYNLANRHTLIQVPVINDGDVTLNPDKLMNQLAAMKLSLSYGLNNLRRRND